jgi:hypothetical protein
VAKVDPLAEPSDSDLKDELRRRLLTTVSIRDLADEIADLLKAWGRKPGTPEKVATALASKLVSKFAKPNRGVEQLIENRPRQLHALMYEIVSEECQRFIKANAEILRARKTRAKAATKEERLHRIKASKNRYERRRSRYLGYGLIEREFSGDWSFPTLGILDPPAPSGPCLDEIFYGGKVKMCGGMNSLQSLFGLSRKKLSAAGSGIRVGRERFYNYRAVLSCMNALLKEKGRNACWLLDTDRRRTVLTGILSRARQKATDEIYHAFEVTLRPYLS